jgi:hypothetical protein
VATFDGRNALPLEPRIRNALPAPLQQLLASPACTLTVFEDHGRTGLQALSIACGLFVRPEVVERYLDNPAPAFVTTVLGELLDCRPPLLTLEEIRRANSSAGLDVALYPMPRGALEWDDPQTVELRKLAPQAFIRCYSGYRLRSIYYEVFDDVVAD